MWVPPVTGPRDGFTRRTIGAGMKSKNRVATHAAPPVATFSVEVPGSCAGVSALISVAVTEVGWTIWLPNSSTVPSMKSDPRTTISVPPLAGPTVGVAPIKDGCGASVKVAGVPSASSPTLSVAYGVMMMASFSPTGAGAPNDAWHVVACAPDGTLQTTSARVIVVVAIDAPSVASTPSASSPASVTWTVVPLPMIAPVAGASTWTAGGTVSEPRETNPFSSCILLPRGSVTPTSERPAGTPAGTVAASAHGDCQVTPSSAIAASASPPTGASVAENVPTSVPAAAAIVSKR